MHKAEAATCARVSGVFAEVVHSQEMEQLSFILGRDWKDLTMEVVQDWSTTDFRLKRLDQVTQGREVGGDWICKFYVEDEEEYEFGQDKNIQGVWPKTLMYLVSLLRHLRTYRGVNKRWKAEQGASQGQDVQALRFF